MTKPTKIAVGIGAAGVTCALLAACATGPTRLLGSWTAGACAISCGAYLGNRPAWLGKRAGRLSWRALVVLPYLVAFRIAVALMRTWRGRDAPGRVAPGLWVGGRIAVDTVPPGATMIVDLVAEYGAPRRVRRHPGYRSLPVLDGGVPPHADAFLDLVQEIATARGEVLVHCDSGRGRAPTLAAAVLIARGLARDIEEAVARVAAARPVAAPTGSDLRFLAAVLPRLRDLARVANTLALEASP